MSDPKARFLQYVSSDEVEGGKRKKGEGFITERQRQKLQPAYLDYLVQKNVKRKHYVWSASSVCCWLCTAGRKALV